MVTKRLSPCTEAETHVWKWHYAATDIPMNQRRWCIKCKKKYQDLILKSQTRYIADNRT